MNADYSTAGRPGTDERLFWNLIFGSLAYYAIQVAHRLGLFALISARPCTISEICDTAGISRRPALAILSTCVSLGVLKVEEEQYSLTVTAEDYLIETSPTYFGGFLDMLITNDSVFSFDALHRAVMTNSSQVYGGDPLFQSHEEQFARARAFTIGMHGHSAAAARAWPDVVDLAGHRVMLDIGGGSGAHSIGALLHWRDLHAIIFDLAPVCTVAEEFAVRHNLQERIRTHPGDMWDDEFPAADLHFYGDIFHDWPPDRARGLLKKSFNSLPPGGRVVIHEMLYDDDKRGPLPAAAYSIAMLLWTEGQQYSAREFDSLLAEAGFQDIQVQPTFGYWSIVTGVRR